MWLILAQAESIGDRTWEIFGVFSFIVIGLGWFSLKMLNRIFEENKALADQREEMIRTLLQVVPLISQATEVLKERQSLDKEMIDAIEKNTETLKETRWALQRRSEP
jgi:hypothetical protein